MEVEWWRERNIKLSYVMGLLDWKQNVILMIKKQN